MNYWYTLNAFDRSLRGVSYRMLEIVDYVKA